MRLAENFQPPSSIRPVVHQKRDNTRGAPPTFPYIFSLLGSMPIPYLNFFQSAHSTHVKILTQEFYVIRGPKNIRALFRNSWACTSVPFVKFALGYDFGLPAEAPSLYDKDDSSGGHIPYPGSRVEAHDRIDYIYLKADNRFVDNVTRRLYSLHNRIGPEWGYHTDLMKFAGDETTIARLGRVLHAVKAWQQHARDHYKESSAARKSITAASWTIFELYRDPKLLASLRAEIDACAVKSADHLIRLRLPNLQAFYAETLRLRTHFYIIRIADRVDMNIRDWILPKRKVIVTIMDSGPRHCPGRHFAKRQMLLTIALLVSLFDCEMVEEGKDVREDFTLSGFGGGVSHPAGKVPIEIRRRVNDGM
ncbi:cytochrome P450 [Xylaria cubensis]|nr:cytochrome P450 [Xylaria cubensis]